MLNLQEGRGETLGISSIDEVRALSESLLMLKNCYIQKNMKWKIDMCILFPKEYKN